MLKCSAAYVLIMLGLLMGLASCRVTELTCPNTQALDCSEVEIIAHRGASAVAPENTLVAVRLAWQQGCDAVEVDVHLSRDRRIMAIHDPSTRRTAGLHRCVAQTSSDRLRQLDVGRFKDETFAGERIPFLRDILACLPHDRHLFIDIKCGPEIVPLLQAELTRSHTQAQVIFIGRDLDVLTQCKRAMPQVPAFWLRDRVLFGSFSPSLIEEARAAGVDGLDVHWSGVTFEFVSQARSAGLQLYVWTVDRLDVARRLIAMEVQGITTNDPRLYLANSEEGDDSMVSTALYSMAQ